MTVMTRSFLPSCSAAAGQLADVESVDRSPLVDALPDADAIGVVHEAHQGAQHLVDARDVVIDGLLGRPGLRDRVQAPARTDPADAELDVGGGVAIGEPDRLLAPVEVRELRGGWHE